ncbi:hypothetical protein KY284_006591 [Solanum tuberosum]|nr:hypothetical protein KY284_006591 [Solanum tuberosum]
MPQTQPIPVIEVRNDEYQGGDEGEGEKASWNDALRNRPRGQMEYRGRGGRFGPVPHGRRPYGNQTQSGEQREAYANQEYGEVQRGYYNHDQGGNGGRDVGINSIKTNLPPFKGECNPDDYLEWESLCERILQVNDLTKEYVKRYHLVLQDGHPPPWTGLKALMRVKYVPERYQYTENEEHVVIRFKVGLNKEISSKMTIHKFASLNDIFEAANEVERELKKEKVPKYKGKDFKKPYEKKPFEGDTPKYPPREGGNNDPTELPKGIQCHKCRGWCHMMCECPNRLNVLVQGGELYLDEEVGQEEGCEEETQEEGEFEGDEDEEQDPCEGKDVAIPNGLMRKVPIEEAWPQEGDFTVPMYVVRQVMISKAMDDPSQRENLFHSKCLIKDNVCSLIIDSGSCANVASTALVEFLKLLTTMHATPYKLQWLSECGELRIHKQVLIKLKIGKYQDEILYDVLSMQACHMLLGRPWQYDRSTKHEGRTNKYSLVLDDHKYVIHLMSPSQVNEVDQKMSELREKKKGEKEHVEAEGKEEG